MSSAGCAGPPWTSTAGCCSANATAPPPATTLSKATPRPPPGRRAVALDKPTLQVPREHRRRQLARRDRRHTASMTCTDSGYVFTRKDGEPINPHYTTTRFRKNTERAGLPPVRLYDLRHGAAALAYEAGADLKPLQDLLGHSSIVSPPTPRAGS